MKYWYRSSGSMTTYGSYDDFDCKRSFPIFFKQFVPFVYVLHFLVATLQEVMITI